ncbi:MAG TPA: hypothetical protein VKS21_08685, partial [Spirochaetota bacterium]|nr:hypothetical protein [Spirochaetota bacterium]
MKKKTLNRLFKVLLVSGDSVFSLAALVFAYYFRFYAEVVPVKHGIPEVKYYLMAAPVVIIVFLLAFNYTGLYRNDRKHSGYSEIAGVFISVTAGTVILLAGTFFIREFTYSRGAILLMWGATVIFVGAWRLLYRAFYIYLSRKEMIINRILVAGATEMSGMLIERLKRSPGMGYRIVGCLDNKIKKGEKFRGVKVLGGIKELRRVLNEKKVDEVFVGAADYNRKEIADTILENENVSFMIVSDVLGIITKSIDYDSFFGIPVFAVKELPLNKMRNRFMK